MKPGTILLILGLAVAAAVFMGSREDSFLRRNFDGEVEGFTDRSPAGAANTPSLLPRIPASSSPEPPPGQGVLVGVHRFLNRAAPDPALVTGSLPDGVKLSRDESSNSVLYRVPEEGLGQVVSLLRQLDTLERSYEVEAVLVVVELASVETFSVDWLASWADSSFDFLDGSSMGTAGSGPGGLSVAAGWGPLSVAIEKATQAGRLSVVARPRLHAVEGTTVAIATGREVPVASVSQGNATTQTSITYREVEFRLQFTLLGLGDGRVRVQVEQQNDQVADVLQIDGNDVPVLSTESVTSTVDVTPGHWSSVGGLRVDQSTETKRGPSNWLWALLGGSRSRDNSRAELGFVLRVVEPGPASPEPARIAPAMLETEPPGTVRVPRKIAPQEPGRLPLPRWSSPSRRSGRPHRP